MSPNNGHPRILVKVDPELESLIPTFLLHRQEEVQALRTAFQQFDYDMIQTMGHMMKGVGGGYGFWDLSDLAAQLMLAAKNQNVRKIQESLNDLSSYLERVDVVYELEPENGPLIFCVDDESMMLKLMLRLWSQKGFRVLTSPGGADALSLVAQNRPDIILMDIRMPQMDGHELCRRLHDSRKGVDIPVIFVSGFREETPQDADCGVVDVVLKPFDQDALVHKVVQTLQTKSRWKGFKLETTPLQQPGGM